MDCALELKVNDIICDPDANRFRITKADVQGYKIDIAYVPVDGGDEISETLTVDDFVMIVDWEGKEAETEATPEPVDHSDTPLCACGEPTCLGTCRTPADDYADAMDDNRDVLEEMERNSRLHFDTGAAGRDVCPKHGTELDPFGACLRCEMN